jgi:excisionase family DNA binding protein
VTALERERKSNALRDLGGSLSGRLKFYTIVQVAEILEMSTRSVRRLIAAGELPVHRFGRSVRIAETDLRAFIAVHRTD